MVSRRGDISRSYCPKEDMTWVDGPIACTLSISDIMVGQIVKQTNSRDTVSDKEKGLWAVFDYHTGNTIRLPGIYTRDEAKKVLEIAQSIKSIKDTK